MKERGLWQRVALWLLGAVFILGVLLLFVGTPEGERAGSVASAKPEGRRAAFLLLRELGFRPRIWSQAPLALPEGEHLLWMADAPFDFLPEDRSAPDEEPEEEEPGPVLADPRHPKNYARFVESGGTLILPAREEVLDWLAKEVEIELPPWHPARSDEESLQVELETGEQLTVVADLNAELDESAVVEESDYRWRDLAVDGRGRPFAAWIPVANGRVALLADDGFLRNDALGEADDGLLLVRLVESLDRGGELLLDEYALGLWVPPSSAGLLLAPGLREVSFHALLFALGLVLFAAWVREFPRDPAPLTSNPRLRARSQARLLERAGRFDLLGRELRLGVLRRLARQWRLSRALTVLREDAEPAAIAEVARRVAFLAGCAAKADEWAALFAGGGERRRADLERLGEALAGIEHLSETRFRGTTPGRREAS